MDLELDQQTSPFFYRVFNIIDRITLTCLSTDFFIRCEPDNKYGQRYFIQIIYYTSDINANKIKRWHGRKFYLSEHMTDDEIIKTIYLAYEQVIKHEAMEGFKVDDKILFNPHTNFEALLNVSDQTVGRISEKEHT